MKKSKSPDDPIVYLTRACDGVSWDLWTTNDGLLHVRKDQVLRGRAITCDMNALTQVKVVAVKDFQIGARESLVCSPGKHILLDSVPQAASTKALIALISPQGITPAKYLLSGFMDPDDLELALGKRTHELFAVTVTEMMERGYDIMHHWPLFSRALTMYFEEPLTSDLPSFQEMIESPGLLDLSSKEHVALHDVELQGCDQARYNMWKYSCQPLVMTKEATSETCEAQMDVIEASDRNGAVYDISTGVEASAKQSYPESFQVLDPTVQSIVEFNSYPLILADSQISKEYKVKVWNDVTFDYLIDYCTDRTSVGLGGLPGRSSWGTVNPVLLMNDPFDPCRGKNLHTYVLTSRGNLSRLRPFEDLCYNEVFLPGRPVSRLNLDIDLKCCSAHHVNLSVKVDDNTRFNVCKLMVISLISALSDVLISMGSSMRSTLDPADVGKVAVYTRVSSKVKLSLRMLWYLPVELCSLSGIDAYSSLIRNLSHHALRYALLSKPADPKRCGLCDIEKVKGKKVTFGDKCLLVSYSNEPRKSAVDIGPYRSRSTVRLPNCNKEDAQSKAAFMYVATFNSKFPNPDCESPEALSVGLSSSSIEPDVTSLGPGFAKVLCGREHGSTRSAVGSALAIGEKRLSEVRKELKEKWGVETTVERNDQKWTIVEAISKSNFKCPKHNLVHDTHKLRVKVLQKDYKYICFVD